MFASLDYSNLETEISTSRRKAPTAFWQAHIFLLLENFKGVCYFYNVLVSNVNK